MILGKVVLHTHKRKVTELKIKEIKANIIFTLIILL